MRYGLTVLAFKKFMRDEVLPMLDHNTHDLQVVRVEVYVEYYAALGDTLSDPGALEPFTVVDYTFKTYETPRGLRDESREHKELRIVLATPHSLQGLMG
jgi:hypothetical protein